MEDIQDLLQIETKSNYECEQIKLMTEELKRRIMNERITPEKQEEAGIQFFRALGRGCPWGKSQYDDNSIDARLLGCACCGMKD